MLIKNLVSLEATIADVLKLFSKYSSKTLIVTDEKNNLKGTISDGDIRKAILKKKKLNHKITNLYNKNPKYIFSEQYSDKIAKQIFLKFKIELIPIITKDKKILKIIFWNEVFSEKRPVSQIKKKLPAVIMAGGLGTRLEPFTNILPKPLLPVNDKPVIDHIIDHMIISGIKEIFISVNYKAKILKAYFLEKINLNCKINFIEENKPLGTAGSLSLLKNKKNQDYFVTNCDSILNIDYSDLLEFHEKKKILFTIVACNKSYEFPYGNLSLTNKGTLNLITEKPNFNFLANAGAYLINSKLLKFIPKNRIYNFDEFIENLIRKNTDIYIYPINENDWKDVGQWSQFREISKNF